jgi:hypothetical protein
MRAHGPIGGARAGNPVGENPNYVEGGPEDPSFPKSIIGASDQMVLRRPSEPARLIGQQLDGGQPAGKDGTFGRFLRIT